MIPGPNAKQNSRTKDTTKIGFFIYPSLIWATLIGTPIDGAGQPDFLSGRVRPRGPFLCLGT
jgi:hypothetical protein